MDFLNTYNIYKVLVAAILILAILFHGYRSKSRAFVFLSCLLLFAVCGLRDGTKIGADALSYLHMFQRLPEYTYTQAANINGGSNAGFFLLAKAVSDFTNGDFQVLVTLIAAFTFLCFAIIVYRYSPNPLESILLFFGLLLYTFHFTALKQSIAMGFIMLAFSAIVEQKPIRFIVLVIIGTLFHFPALAFLPAYWLAKLRFNRNYLISLAIILVLVFVFRNPLINLMLNLYKDSEATVDISNTQFLRTKVIIMIGIVVAAVVFREPQEDDRLYTILLVLMGPAIVLQTFCGYSNIFERLADYYFQFSVLFIPMIFDKKADRKPLIDASWMSTVDLIAPYLFCGYSIYRFVVTTTNSSVLYPFVFFFESR